MNFAITDNFGKGVGITPWLTVAIFLFAGPGSASQDPIARQSNFQRGFTLAGWWSEAYIQKTVPDQVQVLSEGGVDWLSIVTRWFQETRNSTLIEPCQAESPSDASLRRVIRLARKLGMQVMLKPHIDLLKEGWRGEIAFVKAEDWDRWFKSYTTFILHHARLAEEEKVSLFCVGVELDGTRHREKDWRAVIEKIRRKFSGSLTYAANWGREADITWWEALDYAGVDAYFPLAEGAGASVAEIQRAWKEHREHLRTWQSRIHKPVIFTEVGFRSLAGAAVKPWEWKTSGRVSLDEQARLYEATLEIFWKEPWFYGFYWWCWDVQPPKDSTTDSSFSPQDKPAWKILKSFYLR